MKLWCVLSLVVVGSLVSAASASAAITTPFGPTGPTCTPNAGDRECTGIVASFDGAPIDVKLRLPAAPANPLDADGPYPLVMGFHGWGGSKNEYNLDRWVNKGYAAFTMSDRGWGMSCGGQDPKRIQPQCTGVGPTGSKGYNHLMDTRYEVRDAQEMAAKLVDNDVVDPDAIGATGPSYGGGISMSLAALNNRKMLTDGSLVPWVSPEGTPLSIAAAAPEIPWSDLAYSLVPNGSTLDYAVASDYDQRPIGVMKQSFVAGLYAIGVATSNFAPAGTDPTADVNGWYARLNGGEPYEGDPTTQRIVDEVTEFHSSYYIDSSVEPAPLLISNGWTDDLFPVDEAVRFYNRTRDQYPNADISMVHFDHGHARGQNKGADAALLDARQEAWFDHYLKGVIPKPPNQVETLTQTCPKATVSGGPFTAATWAELAPGEVRFQSADQQVIAPEAGSPQASQAYDPIAGGGACATAPGDDSPGVASYRLDAAPVDGYTLMGSPTVVADVLSPGPSSQLTSRLVDVDPDTGDATLVARGVYRPTTGTAASRQVFQLHPNGYEFAAGHIAKLELLPSDAPYARKSNGQAPITVSNLDLRLPVLEQPGAPAAVTEPAPKVVPAGYELSDDYGSPADGDADGDGVADSADNCDDAPGPASNAGCPLPDSDGDGVEDSVDECDNDPGPAGNAGCPENPIDDDADDDGVLDSDDACPDEFGPADNAGCPEPADDDGDGVEDSVDDCDAEPGPATNAGCPEPDTDGDGVVDVEDGCVTQSGPASNAGCPLDNDDDADGLPNSQDSCQNAAGPADNSGCPVPADTDGDGVRDNVDACLDVAGPPSNEGCPLVTPPPAASCTDVLRGTAKRDRMNGTGLSERIVGRRGGDRLSGRGGDDCISGGAGADRINGGKGADRISGGSGRDRIFARDGEVDLIDCGKGRDRVKSDPEDELKNCEATRKR